MSEQIPEKRSYSAEEYTPEVKRQKMQPREVKLRICENCGAQMVLPDGTCMECGVGPRIGGD